MEVKCGGAVARLLKKHLAANMQSMNRRTKKKRIKRTLRMKNSKLRHSSAFAVKKKAIKQKTAQKIQTLEGVKMF